MGSPKALLAFGTETMLQRVVRLLGTIVSPVVVVVAPQQLLPELPALIARDSRWWAKENGPPRNTGDAGGNAGRSSISVSIERG